MVAYNQERPHDALGGLPPSIFSKRLRAEISTFDCKLDGELTEAWFLSSSFVVSSLFKESKFSQLDSAYHFWPRPFLKLTCEMLSHSLLI
jgi:hypothetical protein